MATVVRIKRRRHEDVADMLLLSCKKSRRDGPITDGTQTQQSEELTGVLKFAGTVSSKTSGVSNPVKVAIRKEKLEREYKHHQLNVLGEIRQQTRHNQRQSSQKNRYTVTAKHRAPHLDSLDQIDTLRRETLVSVESQVESRQRTNIHPGPCLNESAHTATSAENPVDELCSDRSCDCCIVADDSVTNGSHTCGKIDHSHISKTSTASVSKHSEYAGSGNVSQNATGDDVSPGGDSGDGMFCLVDMEARTTLSHEVNMSEITCNAMPMVQERVEPSDEYVYDLYYTNSRDFDFRLLDDVLYLQPCGERLVHDSEISDDDAAGGDDDDDSNDEGNWRNDYPDQDPGFLDNDGAEYTYGEDMADNIGFEEDTDHLADWMTWRRNIEQELSSDDDIQQYEGAGETTVGECRPQARDDQDSGEDDHSDTND